MTNRAMSMNHVGARSVCTSNVAAHSAFMNAACFFSVLRFYFYFSFYFTGLHPSERQRIS